MFEWDENKRLKVLEKHRLDFHDCWEVFDGPHLIQDARSEAEHRQKAVGYLDGVLITIIFTTRGDLRRLISARRARENERRGYQAIYH